LAGGDVVYWVDRGVGLIVVAAFSWPLESTSDQPEDGVNPEFSIFTFNLLLSKRTPVAILCLLLDQGS
jgi:hypothetical protein